MCLVDLFFIMADTFYFSTGTPLSKKSRTRDEQSLLSGLGGEPVSQRRRKFADDMAHNAVLAEQDEFIDAFFPISNHYAGTIPLPLDNPFASLSDADNMIEAKVREAFVSGGYGAKIYINVLISKI